ncbi:MAG: hypothetical protein AAGB22_08645 [Bacteroidota bacterium]
MKLLKIHAVYLVAFVIAFNLSPAQAADSDTINQVDAQNKRQGHWIFTGKMKKLPAYKPEQKVEEGRFKDSRKNGLWNSYYPNTKLKNEINYVNHRPKGKYVTYYDNGVVEEEGNWNNRKNTGTFKRFYRNGKPHQEFEFNASGKREGTQKYYHENGQLMIEGNWQGGQEAGKLTEYYADGSLKSERYFDNGAIDATKTKNYTPKTPVKEPDPVPEPEAAAAPAPKAVAKTEKTNLGKFKCEGEHTLYNRDRQISQKGIFRNCKIYTGKVYRYNSDGIIQRIDIYQEGKYVGEGVIPKEMR